MSSKNLKKLWKHYKGKGTFILPEEVKERKRFLAYQIMCAKANSGKGHFEDAYQEEMDIVLSKLPLKLKPFQRIPVFIGYKCGIGAFYLTMGAGKTVIALSIIFLLQKLKNKGKNPLIVAPKSVLREWEDEHKRFFASKGHNLNITLTTYESLHKVTKPIDIVVFDESQKIKNPKTQLFENAVKLIKKNKIKLRFTLTGTPDHNTLIDTFTQTIIPNPFSFQKSYSAIIKDYFYVLDMGQYQSIKPTKRAITYFKQVLNKNSIILTKSQLKTESKYPVLTKKVGVDLNAKQRKLLEVFQDELEMALFASQMNVSQLKHALIKEVQISSGFLNLEEGKILNFPSQKLAVACEIIRRNILKNQQIIVWVTLIKTGEKILHAFPHDAMFIHGQVPKKKRDAIISAFKQGRFKILVMQLKTGYFGLNLQFVNKMIFVEPDWNHSNIDQAIARCAREGQTKPVIVYKMYSKETVEEYMWTVVENKAKISKQAVTSYFMTRVKKK